MTAIIKTLTLVIILLISGIQQSVFSQNIDTTANGYILMKVKSDILDCPHFSVILPQELVDRQKIELIKTDNKTYMLFKVKTTNNDAIERFNSVIQAIQFPKENITELIDKESYSEIEKLLPH